MPTIRSIETWICRKPRPLQYEAQGHRFWPESRACVVKVTDEDGVEGVSSCISEYSEKVPQAYLHDIIIPLVLGRDVYDRELIWHDLWDCDRRARFLPLHLLGTIDVALWEIAAKRANLPLYRFLGATRTSLPVYYSGQFMDVVDDYVTDIKRAIRMGFKAYKAHSKDTLDVYTALRETAGSDMVLMADCVADWTFEHALRVGRHLERLNFHWFEEPFRDWNLERYARLAAALDIPIAGTETSTGGVWGVAQAIHYKAVDIVRADTGYGKMGITDTLKIAHLAEAFGMNCELHCTMMGVTDIANLHVSCAIKNCEYFELHMPETQFQFPMKDPYPIDNHGMIHVPQKPGLGIDIDWDSVDNATHAHFEAER